MLVNPLKTIVVRRWIPGLLAGLAVLIIACGGPAATATSVPPQPTAPPAAHRHDRAQRRAKKKRCILRGDVSHDLLSITQICLLLQGSTPHQLLVLSLVLLSILQVNVWSLLLSITSLLVSLSFAFACRDILY